MTTLIGMVAKGAIVIAADPQANVYDEEKLERTPPIAKISTGHHHALAFTGGIDEDYMPSLFEYLASETPDFEAFYKTQIGSRPNQEVLDANFAYSKKIYNANIRLNTLLEGRARKTGELEELCIKLASGDYKAKRPLEKMFADIMNRLQKNPDPITRAVTLSYFREVQVYNRGVIAREGDDDDTVEFLLATNVPELALIRIDSYGSLFAATKAKDKPFTYITLGEGTTLADDYIKKGLFAKDKDLPNEIQVGSRKVAKTKLRDVDPLPWQVAAWLCVGAVTHASQLATTGQNPDVVVVTKNAVYNLTTHIRKTLRAKKCEAYEGVFGDLKLDNDANTDPEDED